MATSDLKVTVTTDVELAPGEKTAAWLVSLGWTPPVEEEASSELVEELAPSSGLAQAAAALKGREAGRLMAQNLRSDLMGELSSPERVDTLLELCGVRVEALLIPVVGTPAPVVEVPAEPVVDETAEPASDAASEL